MTQVTPFEGEFRRIFDTIPEQFDRCRQRYTPALFEHLIAAANVQKGTAVLELGPGTGQATEPILATECDYFGIEIGDNFTRVLQEKYGSLPHFHLIHDDFITHDFGTQQFDLIYSAATIQWIPVEIAFQKTLSLLKPGGMLAMMRTRRDYRTPNEARYQLIQQAYDAHFKPAVAYPHRNFPYKSAPEWGYTDLQEHHFHDQMVLTADEYVDYCGTHCDHIVIPEPHKTQLFEGLRSAVNAFGGEMLFLDDHVLVTARKPL